VFQFVSLPRGVWAAQASGLQSAHTTPVGNRPSCAACRAGWT